VSRQLAYIPAHAEPHAAVEVSDRGVMITRPAIGLRRAGVVFATTLTALGGSVVWMLASLDSSTPLPPLGLAVASLLCAALCAYAWTKTIDEASRRYVLFASPTGLQIRSEGLLGERNELWRAKELFAVWLERMPNEKNESCRQLFAKTTAGEAVSILSYLDLSHEGVDASLREAIDWKPQADDTAPRDQAPAS
jgi:hypothetical protein